MQIDNLKKKTLIIAEVGPNHNGSLKTALKIIKQVASTGADVIKFQLANPEDVYSKDAFMADMLDSDLSMIYMKPPLKTFVPLFKNLQI